MTARVENFIRSNLSPSLPPANPLLRRDWIGMAFDRNLYELFAPQAVWEAWLKRHIDLFPGNASIEVVLEREIARDSEVHSLSPSLDSLREFWRSNNNFLNDHYVFSESGAWIVRLDQDVTLFTGEQSFVSHVLIDLGGG
ncbi:hypothetical protein MUU75_16075 [Pseudoxanthomonas mexicana]|uniref:hypothetical protein n=1 Tax=Pseudoxanthomonas mexicana TaxID=128785 RepID=UPI001FD6C112|nr:hypothetical protein [Pseudoxanthomonas mexicana]UOV04601.1 hypothetical protein MUU75_16075 [Pseudoxanthomonas mexicana]